MLYGMWYHVITWSIRLLDVVIQHWSQDTLHCFRFWMMPPCMFGKQGNISTPDQKAILSQGYWSSMKGSILCKNTTCHSIQELNQWLLDLECNNLTTEPHDSRSYLIYMYSLSPLSIYMRLTNLSYFFLLIFV